MKDKWMKYLRKAVLFTMLLLTMPVGVSAAAKVEKVTYPKGTYIPDRFSEYPDRKVERTDEFKASAQAKQSKYITENLPAIRDQGEYGTCWAFSSIALCEINLMKKGYSDVDLSELHLAYFANHSVNDPLGGLEGDTVTRKKTNYLDYGGNYSMGINTLGNWKGAVSESAVPYDSAATILSNGLSETQAYQSVAYLKGYSIVMMSDQEQVKQAIVDYGAAGITCYTECDYTYDPTENKLYSYSGYYNPFTAGYYCDQEITPNHAVVIVGWDDNYSTSNFLNKPAGKGAWIVRNTWGSSFGDQGYYYLSYYDASIANDAVVFDAEMSNDCDNNYQYDGGLYGTGYKADAAANIFMAHANAGEVEELTKISFEVYMADKKNSIPYTVEVYTNLTDAENPQSGMLEATAAGTVTSDGRYTVTLPQPVYLMEGETFSVVLKSDGGYIVWENQTETNNLVSQTAAKAGQSFEYNSGIWHDYGKSEQTNVRIKAYTKNVSSDSALNGWVTIAGKDYWYENGVRQGYDPNNENYRGKEIYDPSSDAWYWLDNVQQGAKAVSKDVYQDSDAGQWADREDGTGKWVRYDENGHMIKGWQETEAGVYYFDPTYGTMAKGTALIDGVSYYFDPQTGIRQDTTGWITVDGVDYWYENGIRQGYDPNNQNYRGKEIYDPSSDAWYWLDNVQQGAKAVGKDVYQESAAGDWGDSVNESGEKVGKWVRYDGNGYMVKGWQTSEAGTYYFDPTYGTMAKGNVVIDNASYYFDPNTGILQNN